MIILITGGSSGLGESITRAFAQDVNNRVYFTYNRSAGNSNKIAADHSNAIPIKCDFKAEKELADLINQIPSINPDVLINNAYSGVFIDAYFHKIPADDFLKSFKDNIIPTIEITQAVISCYRKKKSGRIITILTSALVNTPPIGASIYTVNKAYLQQLAKTWATENVKYNICSNTVSPSFMITNFTKDVDERVVEQIKETHPLKNILTTDAVAEAVYFLANASDHINGTDIVINSASNIR